MKCIFLSGNLDHSWQRFQSVSLGNAKPFPLAFQVLHWVQQHSPCPAARVTACSAGDALSRALSSLKKPPCSYRVISCGNGRDFCLPLPRRQWGHGPNSARPQSYPQPTPSQAWERAARCWTHAQWPALPCPLPCPLPQAPPGPPAVPSPPLQLSSLPTAGGNDSSLLNSLLQKRTWIKSKRPLPWRCSEITDLEESVEHPTLRSWKECAVPALTQERGPPGCCGYTAAS